jgi:hypothetical protein
VNEYSENIQSLKQKLSLKEEEYSSLEEKIEINYTTIKSMGFEFISKIEDLVESYTQQSLMF